MKYRTIVADPPWRFANRSGKSAPEHGRLYRYPTMDLADICAMGPRILDLTANGCHLYMWIPTALINHGLLAMASWGFDYKTKIHWEKVTKAGLPDRSCMGFYYRNVVEPCLFGNLDGKRTNHWNIPNLFQAPKGRHSEKPEVFFDLVQKQSDGPFLELFARGHRPGWDSWGNEVKSVVLITTDISAVESWRELVGQILKEQIGAVPLKEIYEKANDRLKVGRAKAQSHKWKAQIRRTLQRHFFPQGKGFWKVA